MTTLLRQDHQSWLQLFGSILPFIAYWQVMLESPLNLWDLWSSWEKDRFSCLSLYMRLTVSLTVIR